MKFIRGESIPFVPASHEDPRDPGVLKRVLAGKSELLNGRVQMVNWSWLPAGRAFRAHYHEDLQEVFVIISGRAKMTVDGDTTELVAGDAIVIEPREVHSMSASGKQDVFYVVFGISTEQGGRTVVVET